jgi:hypothetical protein
MRYHETGNAVVAVVGRTDGSGSIPMLEVGHQRNRVSPRKEAAELDLTVRNADRKAELVDAPQHFEVGGTVIANAEFRPGALRYGCQVRLSSSS